MQFDSHQPLEHKLGVIRTLTHRARTIVTTEEDKKEEENHLKKVLSVSKYTKWSWNLPGKSKKIPHPKKSSGQRSLGHVTIPYVQGISEAISRKIRKAGVSAHVRPINTIRQQLVRPKDKEKPENKCGIVYEIPCKNCDAKYVGETERALKKRITEHKRPSSPVGSHLKHHGHELDQENIKIVDREDRWFERGVREAIHIRSRSPSLNRDQGRHQLPIFPTAHLAESRVYTL